MGHGVKPLLVPGGTCDNCQNSNRYNIHFTWILEVGTSTRYLGVGISSGISWNSNIDRITGNANRTLGYIRRNIKSQKK